MDGNSQKVTRAFLLSRIFSTPLWALITLLPYILYKDLHISIFLVTLTLALKPLSALLAPYFSLKSYKQPKKLLKNTIKGNFLRYVPFFFLPLFPSPFFTLSAFFFYMIFSRGITPAWMELIKQHIPADQRELVFQRGNTFEYVGMILMPFVLGSILDQYPHSWRLLFPLAAILGFSSSLFLLKIKEPQVLLEEKKQDKSYFFAPFIQSYQLLLERKDFFHYILGFMLGGTGLMVIQPALSIYYVDELMLSYKEILMALSLCKGVGFSLSSSFWVKQFRNHSIYQFSSKIALLAALFPLLLLLAKIHIAFLYLSFLLYGAMQSGSELSWHMSGIVFAEEEESTLFSSTNILAVGIRGCAVPFLGYLLLSLSGPIAVMGAGCLFCLAGSVYLGLNGGLTAASVTKYN